MSDADRLKAFEQTSLAYAALRKGRLAEARDAIREAKKVLRPEREQVELEARA